ncbi:hypothetical protein LEA_09880 [human gut metagenome]|uniref:Uncharacterized protein n=1 Tax=human gut metagenome TaxID=408170 RepID=K1T079_9ZZZZ
MVCSGIQDALEQEKLQGSEIQMSLITVDDTNTFSVEESIRDIFMDQLDEAAFTDVATGTLVNSGFLTRFVR